MYITTKAGTTRVEQTTNHALRLFLNVSSSRIRYWYLYNIIVWLERSIMLTIYSHGWKFTKLVETFRDRLSLLKQGISINGGKVIEGQGAASRARVLEYHVQRKSKRKEIGSRRELDNHVFRAWKGSEMLNNGWRMDEYWSRPCWSLISWLDPHSSINSSMSPRQIVTKFWISLIHINSCDMEFYVPYLYYIYYRYLFI